eukprot:3232572-Karenia_brevis.AAC.1
MDVDSRGSGQDPRTTEEKIDSTLDSLAPGTTRAKSRGRETSRQRGGIPQPKYNLEDVLQSIKNA